MANKTNIVINPEDVGKALEDGNEVLVKAAFFEYALVPRTAGRIVDMVFGRARGVNPARMASQRAMREAERKALVVAAKAHRKNLLRPALMAAGVGVGAGAAAVPLYHLLQKHGLTDPEKIKEKAEAIASEKLFGTPVPPADIVEDKLAPKPETPKKSKITASVSTLDDSVEEPAGTGESWLV